MADIVQITIIGKDQASAALAKVRGGVIDLGDTTKSQGSGIGGFFKDAFAFATGGLLLKGLETLASTVSGLVTDSFAAAKETRQIMAQTEQTIKSTGGVAGVTAQQVADLASSLSDAAGKSLFGDDQIQQAENMLLTFTTIGKDVFPDATQASLDMAQALKKTPEAMSMMIGKALNSAEGFSALKKSGVSFSDEQERMIKTLFDTGHAADAQKLILQELNKEFGGQAEAAAKAEGGMAQFKARIGELGESLATKVLPLFDQLGGFLNDTVAPALESVVPMIEKGLATIGSLADKLAAGDFSGFLTELEGIGEQVGPIFSDLASKAGAWIADAIPVFEEKASAFFGALLGWVGASLPGWAAELTKLATAATEWVIAALPGLGKTLGQLYNRLINWVVDSLPGWMAQLQKLGEKAIQWVTDAMPGLGTNLGKMLGQLLGWIVQTSIDVTPKLLALGLKFLDWIAESVIPKLPGALLAIATGIYNFISEVVKEVGPKLAELAGKFLNWVDTDVLPKLPGVLDDIKNGIGKWIGDTLGWLGGEAARIGGELVAGIKQGIQNAWGSFTSWLLRQAQSIIDNFLEQYGIGSPSRVMAEQVGEPLVLGIMRGMEALLPDLLSQIGSISDDMLGEIEQLGDAVHDALADAFDAEASIDRQAARNIDAVERLAGNLQAETQAALDEAMRQAGQIQDPGEAAKFFKERSQQILELAKLQEELQEAQSTGDSRHAYAISRQIELIQNAQEAEQEAFRERQHGQSPLEQIAEQLQELLLNKDLPGALNDTSGLVQQLFNWLTQIRQATAPPIAPPIPPQQQGMMPPPIGGQGLFGGQGLLAGGGAGMQVIFQAGAIVATPGMDTQTLAEQIIAEIRRRTQGRF